MLLARAITSRSRMILYDAYRCLFVARFFQLPLYLERCQSQFLRSFLNDHVCEIKDTNIQTQWERGKGIILRDHFPLFVKGRRNSANCLLSKRKRPKIGLQDWSRKREDNILNGCRETSFPRWGATWYLLHGDVERHLLSVPERPSSGTPTAGSHWSHGPHHREQPTMSATRSRDWPGNDGARKQRGQRDKRSPSPIAGQASSILCLLFKKREREKSEKRKGALLGPLGPPCGPSLSPISRLSPGRQRAVIHKSDRSAEQCGN